jgi:hypothetical protein
MKCIRLTLFTTPARLTTSVKRRSLKTRLIILMVTIALPVAAHGASYEHTGKVTRVMAYAKSSNYEANDCVLYFDQNTPTQCPNKRRAVIKSGTEVGLLMCSVALTAFVSGKTVTIASTDECSPTHSSPIIRYLIANES